MASGSLFKSTYDLLQRIDDPLGQVLQSARSLPGLAYICDILAQFLECYALTEEQFYLSLLILRGFSDGSEPKYARMIVILFARAKKQSVRKYIYLLLSGGLASIAPESSINSLKKKIEEDPEELTAKVSDIATLLHFEYSSPQPTMFTTNVHASTRDFQKRSLSQKDLYLVFEALGTLPRLRLKPPAPMEPSAGEFQDILLEESQRPLPLIFVPESVISETQGGSTGVSGGAETRSSYDELRTIFARALTSKLRDNALNALLEAIRRDPSLPKHFSVTGTVFTNLAKHNPKVAAPLLQSLWDSAPESVGGFLDAIIKLGLCRASFETISLLPASLVSVPYDAERSQVVADGMLASKTFVEVFLNMCIDQVTQEGNSSIRHRQARLVCVFLMSIMRYIEVSEVYALELEPFCLQFAHIPEANDLYQKLREIGKSSESSS